MLTLDAITLERTVVAALFAAIVVYALLGGADFGGGVWDLFASGPRAREQREALAAAIAPVWEANHVWLIVVVVLLFTAFSSAFAVIMTALFIPLMFVLIGIVLRGSAFVFRKYDAQHDEVNRRWSTLFGAASLITPLFQGMAVAAVATGEIRVQEGVLQSGWLAGWTAPFAVACGLFAVAMFAFLAAAYMTVDLRGHPDLQEDFRSRGLISGLALAPLALIVFYLSRTGAPELFAGLTDWWAPWLLAVTSVFAIGSLLMLWQRRYALVRVFAAAQVGLILLGWGLAQYPYLIVPDVTYHAAAAPEITLRLTAIGLAAGSVILIPSLALLYWVFKRPGKGVNLAEEAH